MNILITGARAPAALDLIRRLYNPKHNIYAIDSVKYPISRISNKIKKCFFITNPKENIEKFIRNLENHIIKYKIDILIPTCEEVFFISKHKQRLEKHCMVFCDSFEKNSTLHNKYKFLELAANCGAKIPSTILIKNKNDLTKIKAFDDKILKPVFSRFASNIIINPTKKQLENIFIDKNNPWVMQQYINGLEYCTYSVAHEGKLQIHSCYEPKYRAGRGSGIFFSPVLNKQIENFVVSFVKKHNYTGQIGFDFIIAKKNQLYVIECNPRATSGIHCLPENINWQEVFNGTSCKIIKNNANKKMIFLAMLLFGFKYLISKNVITFIKDFIIAKDPIFNLKDPLPAFYQIISFAEIVIKSFKNNTSLKDAATADIEWNGEKL